MKIESMYVNGVHREIYSWLEERGWHHEWYDGGPDEQPQFYAHN